MLLEELFEEIENDKCTTKLSPRDLTDLEQFMNHRVFRPKDAIQKNGIVLDLDLPVGKHFHQRALERSVSDCEIEQALLKGWNQNFQELRDAARENNPEADELHFVDPDTKIDIPMIVKPNPKIRPDARVQGKAVAVTPGGLKEPKNQIIAKTVVRRSPDSKIIKDAQ